MKGGGALNSTSMARDAVASGSQQVNGGGAPNSTSTEQDAAASGDGAKNSGHQHAGGRGHRSGRRTEAMRPISDLRRSGGSSAPPEAQEHGMAILSLWQFCK
jgi:hypothetical protein